MNTETSNDTGRTGMTTHTPGPWSVIGTNVSGQSLTVAETYLDEFVSRKTAEANARLIAAAPELLEAAKAMLDPLLVQDRVFWARKLRAAIAKAEGRA